MAGTDAPAILLLLAAFSWQEGFCPCYNAHLFPQSPPPIRLFSK